MAREKRVLSSREEGPDIMFQRMEDFLFLLWDVLEKPESAEPPTTMEEILHELDDSLLDLATKYTDVVDSNNRLASDVLSLTIANSSLKYDLLRATKIVAGLCGPAYQDKSFDLAVNTMLREGDADMVARTSGGGLDVNIVFENDEDLREGLRCAIEAYNNDLAGKILTS